MATVKDTLQVDLVVNDAAANTKVDAFVGKLKTADAAINTLNAGDAFARRFTQNLDQASAKVRQLSQTLDAAGAGGGRGFKAAADQAARLHDQLRKLQSASTRTSDPNVLAGLRREVVKTEAEIDRLAAKVDRVASGRSAAATAGTGSRFNKQQAAGITNLGRQGADVFTGLASGQSPAMIAIQQGPQIIDALATSGFKFSAAMAASAISIGAIAAAGAVIVALTNEARVEAEAALKNVEKIQGAINKAILDQKKATEELATARSDAQFQRDLKRDIDTNDADEIRRRRATFERFNELSPTGPNAAKNAQIIADLDARLDELDQKARSRPPGTASFEASWELWKSGQELARKKEEEFEKSIVEGAKKLKQYGEDAKTLFSDLFAASGSSNPFVSVFSEADAAIEKTRLTTAGLNEELRSTADRMTETANANKLFAARVNASLEAADLRFDAERFRSGGPFVDDRIKARLAKVQQDEAGGRFRNVEGEIARLFAGASAGGRLALFDQKRALEESGGLFRNDQFTNDTRRRLAADAATGGFSDRERFNKQLEVLRTAEPANESQRAEVDRKIIELGRNLDPATLSETDRSAVAQALENQAVRTENAEKTAKAEREAAALVQKNIDTNIDELLKIAKKDGLTGVIRIINEAETRAKVELGKRPTETDTAARTNL